MTKFEIRNHMAYASHMEFEVLQRALWVQQAQPQCASTTVTVSPSCTMVEALLVPKTAIWSTLVMHTSPYSSDILQTVHPHHEVLLSCKPHHPGCHQWRPLLSQVHDDLQRFQQM